jgi:hypothetical protein
VTQQCPVDGCSHYFVDEENLTEHVASAHRTTLGSFAEGER